jgi:hypothetical protein
MDAALAKVREQYEVTEVKDRRDGKNLGYRDILINVSLSDGTIAEIQLHIPEIWVLKELEAHNIYKQWEDAMKAGDKAGADVLEAKFPAIYDFALEAAAKRKYSSFSLMKDSSEMQTPVSKTLRASNGTSPEGVSLTNPRSPSTTGMPSTSNLSPTLKSFSDIFGLSENSPKRGGNLL